MSSPRGKDIAEGSSRSPGGGTQVTPSRYESQKRRDWNTFGEYLKNHRPPVPPSQCNCNHVLNILRYLDQFGKTKVRHQGFIHLSEYNNNDKFQANLRRVRVEAACSAHLLGASEEMHWAYKGRHRPRQWEIQIEGQSPPPRVEAAGMGTRLDEKVIALLSMPNLASQLGSPSPSPLGLVLAAAGTGLYVVAVLATVSGYLLGGKRPRVWRLSVIVGSFCTVHAFFCSMALYLPEAYRWLILVPCTILLPPFYHAMRDPHFAL